MRVVVVSSDLMVASRVQGAAASTGATVQVAGGTARAIELLRETAATVLVIDLAMPLGELDSLVREAKSAGDDAPRIVAFGPHVHEDRLAAARAAGCDIVVSRGQFFSQIESLIGESC